MESIVKDICTYIISNISDDISMDKLEEIFYYNKFYLIRIFKAYTGYTIREYVNIVKVLKTIDPLLFTDDTILKIALNNGFNSQEYYSEKFKDVIGISPLKFRKEYNSIEDLKNVDELKMKKEYILSLKEFEQYLLNIPYDLGKKDSKKLRKVA